MIAVAVLDEVINGVRLDRSVRVIGAYSIDAELIESMRFNILWHA